MSEKKRSVLGWLKLIFVITALSAVIAGAVYLVWFSPVFKIRAVELKGETLSDAERAEFLGTDVIDSNIIFWQPNLASVSNSRFESVDIKKSYFKRTIVVMAKEREKNLIWCFTSNSNCFWVDHAGLIFGHAPSSSGELIELVNDARENPPDIGAYVLPADMMGNMHLILAIINKLELPTENIKIEDIKRREVVVYAVNGPKIIFSLSINPDFTETAIRDLMKSSTWGKIKTLNLTVYGRAYPGY